MVFEYDKNPNSFCYWIKGVLDTNRYELIDDFLVKKIQEELTKVFKHEIDPSMGDEKTQAKLNILHNQGQFPKKDGNGQTLYRC